MGGALKAVSKLAGPIMSMASMFTPLGPIMQMAKMAMSAVQAISGAMKSVAPKAMENVDKKLSKAEEWGTRAMGKANEFLTKLSQGFAQLGAIQFPPAAPAPAMNPPLQ